VCNCWHNGITWEPAHEWVNHFWLCHNEGGLIVHPQVSEVLTGLESGQNLNLGQVVDLSDVSEVEGRTVISRNLVPGQLNSVCGQNLGVAFWSD